MYDHAREAHEKIMKNDFTGAATWLLMGSRAGSKEINLFLESLHPMLVDETISLDSRQRLLTLELRGQKEREDKY